MTPARRWQLARWTTAAALLIMVLQLGGSIYEHLVVDSVWPDNVALIQPERGGIDRKLFWMPLHGAVTLLLPLALWAAWRERRARKYLLGATAAYIAIRVWTFAYFIPRALAFESAHELGGALAGEARMWVMLSWLRMPLVIAMAVLLARAGRALASREVDVIP